MIESRYDNHRTVALDLMDAIDHSATSDMLKAAHVEAMIYVGDQINRLCNLIEFPGDRGKRRSE